MTMIKDWLAALEERTRRTLLLVTAGLVLLLLAYSALHSHLGKLTRKKASREQTMQELLVLQQRYQEALTASQRQNNRMATVTATDSPAAIIEQTGLVPKGGIQSKPLPRQAQGQLLEESAEISLAGLSLNETINLLHRLEQGNKPLLIRKGLIRTRFNDQSKLDLTLQVSLFRSPGQQNQP